MSYLVLPGEWAFAAHKVAAVRACTFYVALVWLQRYARPDKSPVYYNLANGFAWGLVRGVGIPYSLLQGSFPFFPVRTRNLGA